MRRLAALAVVTGLVAGGCQGDPHAVPTPSPTGAIQCNDMPLLNGDPGFYLGFDWYSGDHRYQDTAVIYICAEDRGASTVTLEPLPKGVTATPSTTQLDGTGGASRVPVTITVARNASGRVMVTQRFSGGSGGQVGGPKIVAEADTWHLEPSN